MQTLLSRFCEEFVQIVQPILKPLNRTVEAISMSPADSPGRRVQGDLIELRHQVEILADKVEDQQAYVLIFGPLKSGKSTLMNAIASSYVSEVSSLPAYPCMVFVSHGKKREFVVTKYNGKTETFSDAQTLSDYVDAAHKKLASRIRETEGKKEQFDPQQHYRGAIRRIDVKVPAGALEQSGAVLVDTPGLYSRMRFGYDRMTKDFRNAAACAIFVVRSDNLFLEQVFAEFQRLLELFSRIFLLVNIDTAKRDLDPHGKLVPSLEQTDPTRVIDAFENLAMSAPLKAAAEEGRLRIYPLDLLNAASGRLQTDGKTSKNGSEAKGKKAADSKKKDSAFDGFVTDLTDYLNSTDYLVAFLGDSLRRASGLLGECKVICNHGDVRALEQRVVDLETERTIESERIAAFERIGSFPWSQAFVSLQKNVGAAVDGRAKDIAQKTKGAIDTAIDHWFKSNASLQDLVKGDLVAQLTKFQDELALALSKELGNHILTGNAGIDVPTDIQSSLARTGLDLGALGRESHSKIDRDALVEFPPTPLKTEHVEVRKTFVDWILFRSKAAVRRNVFGPADKPTQNIAADQKARRLGDQAKKAMRSRLASVSSAFFAEAEKRIRKDFLANYARATVNEIAAWTKIRTEAAQAQIEQIEKQAAECRSITEPLLELRRDNEQALRAMEDLSKHYGQVDLYLLTQPVEPDYVVPGTSPKDEKKTDAPTIATPETKAAPSGTAAAESPAPGKPETAG